MTAQLKQICATCRHWAGQPGQYRAECRLAPGWHPACHDTCPRYKCRYAPPAASPSPATADAGAGAALDARVAEARRGQP